MAENPVLGAPTNRRPPAGGINMVPATRPATPRLGRPAVPSTQRTGRLKPPEIKGAPDFGDKNLFEKLVDIPQSAVKAIGSGIAAIPTLAGKVAQTGVGLGEFVVDTAADIIDEDIYKSRWETDYERGEELGLEGEALLSYAAQRQYPLASMVIPSVTATARRAAELGTLGRYDTGEEGIDYARAFQEGDLGALLVEDVGNVILGGRALGLGNVVARGGGALSRMGATRTGQAVSTAGRFIEEPIGTTARGAAGTAARSARLASMAPGAIEPLGRVGRAEAPFRQVATELRGAYQAFNERRIADLTSKIADLKTQQDIAQSTGNTEVAQNLQSQIADLESRRTDLEPSVRVGRATARRGTLAGERARQTKVAEFQRIAERGPAPETPASNRQTAVRYRQLANEAEPARAQALREAADDLDRLATLKEQNPEVFSPEGWNQRKAWVEEAAIHFDTGKAPELLTQQQYGSTPDELVRAATDPMVGPYLASQGMQPTTQGVLAAIEYTKAKRGLPSQLSEAEVTLIDMTYAAMVRFSKEYTAAMARGEGMPQGAAPFYWVADTPVPTFMLEVLNSMNATTKAEILQALDRRVIAFLDEMVALGALPETIFDDLGIDRGSLPEVIDDNVRAPADLFENLTKEGDAAIARGDREPLPYIIAFNTVKAFYDDLRQEFPDFIANENIYSAVMRPMMRTRRQGIRRLTGEDVQATVDQLMTIGREYADVIDGNLLTGIMNDIRAALDPTQRIQKSVWERVNKRVITLVNKAADRRDALQTQKKKLTDQQQNELTKLIEADQALGAIQATLRTIAEDPVRAFGETPETARLRTLEENRRRLGMREQVLTNVEASRAARFMARAPEAEVTEMRARPSLRGRTAYSQFLIRRKRDVRKELNRLTAVIRGMDAAVTRKENDVTRQRIAISELENIVRIVEETAPEDRGAVIAEYSELLDLAQQPVPIGYGEIKQTRTIEEQMYEGRSEAPRFPEYYLEVLNAFIDIEPIKARIEQLKSEMSAIRAEAETARAELPARQADILAQREAVRAEGQDLRMNTQEIINDAIARLRSYLDEVDGVDRLEIEQQIASLENLARLYRGRNAMGVDRSLLAVLRQQIAKLDRQIPAQAKRATRSQTRLARERLRGVASVGMQDVEGGAPRMVARLQRGPERKAQGQINKLEGQQRKTVRLIRETQARLRQQDDLLAATENIPDMTLRDQLLREAPMGPQLLRRGEMPQYLPAGPTRGMLRGRDVPMEIRGEGAAPQTRLQSAQQRVSGAFVLTLSGVAARINEVLGQQYRNSTVEQILTDPNVTKTVNTIFTPDELQRMRFEAEASVAAQAIDRTPSEFEREVNTALGNKIIDELDRRGYEVVSPITVDPFTGAHEAVGDLTLSVRPQTVNETSFVMKKGVASRLFSEFERKGAREIPAPIRRILEGVGNGTARWKSHILPLSLRWQIGDAVGIVLFAWLRGDIPPRQLYRTMREVVDRMKDPADPRLGAILFGDVLGSPLVDPVLSAGFGAALQGRGLKVEENRFIEALNARVTGVRPDVGRFQRYDKFRAKAFRLNEAINSIGRASVFLNKLDEILQQKGRSLDEVGGPNTLRDPEITQAITDAVDSTNQVLGAFSDLTPWEKQVMRQVFPFWSWIKFINKAAYELAIDSPDRVLFYAHLGSMAADPDDSGLADWLQGKTPLMGSLFDLSFLNPYSDAIVFTRNPLADATETFTSLSPTITVPLKIGGELAYSMTGREYPFLQTVSRPGYLEGRPEASTRGLGDILGGAAYIGIRGLVPIARNVFDILPTGTIPGTDIATGPVQRFGQGSLRTTGAYAEPRLSPLTGRVGALLRTFGVPAPLISQEMAQRQAQEQFQRDQAARTRRLIERQQAGG